MLCLGLSNLIHAQDNNQKEMEELISSLTEQQRDFIYNREKKENNDIFMLKIVAQSLVFSGFLKKFTPISLYTSLYYGNFFQYYLLYKNSESHVYQAIDAKQKNSITRFHNDLTEQFHSAHFKTKELVQPYYAFIGMALNRDAFVAFSNSKIILNFHAINTIDTVYRKKELNLQLTQKEIDSLNLYSWVLLHESTHIENQDTQHKLGLELATMTSLECLHQWRKRNNPVIKTWKNLPVRTAKTALIYVAMGATTKAISSAYSRYFETRADNFANTHGTTDQLEQAAQFMDKLSDLPIVHQDNTFASHPSPFDRKNAIEKELQRRKQIEN